MASRYLQRLRQVHDYYKQDKKQAFRLCGGVGERLWELRVLARGGKYAFEILKLLADRPNT